MRLRPALVLACIVASGCGGDGDGVAGVVPAGATAYLEVRVRDGEEPTKLVDLLGGEAELADRVLGAVDYEREIRPWLGERIAAFTTPAGAGLVLESTDEAAARRAVRGDDGVRLVDGRVVVSDSRAVLDAAERAADEASLAGTDRYERLGEDREDAAAVGFATRDALPVASAQGATAVVRVGQGDVVAADVEGLERAGGKPPPLSALPATAILAFTSPDLGADLRLLLRLAGDAREDLRRVGIDAGAVLGALGAGRLFSNGDDRFGVDAKPKDVDVLIDAAQTVARRERRAGKSVDVYGPGGGDDRFVQVYVGTRAEDADFYSLEIGEDLADFDVGDEADGDGELLGNEPVFAEASRAVGGEPTALLDASRVPGDAVRGLDAVRFAAARESAGGRMRLAVAVRR